MGDVFITRRGGEIKKVFALIYVTYPSGSTCVCTKGTKTLRAKDTSGAFLFFIPEAGTWTVSCTDGTRTKSRNVIISSQYQVEHVALSYELILFDVATGGDNTAVTGGWSGDGHDWSGATLTVSSSEITFGYEHSFSGNKLWLFGTNNSIDLTPYATLKMVISNRGNGLGSSQIVVLNAIHVQGGSSYASGDPLTQQQFTTAGEVDLDVSALNRSGHIGASITSPGSFVYNVGPIKISKVWLE